MRIDAFAVSGVRGRPANNWTCCWWYASKHRRFTDPHSASFDPKWWWIRLLVTPDALAISLIDVPANPRSKNSSWAASRIEDREPAGSCFRTAFTAGA